MFIPSKVHYRVGAICIKVVLWKFPWNTKFCSISNSFSCPSFYPVSSSSHGLIELRSIRYHCNLNLSFSRILSKRKYAASIVYLFPAFTQHSCFLGQLMSFLQQSWIGIFFISEYCLMDGDIAMNCFVC